MYCKRTGWFICIFVAVVIATGYSDPHSSTVTYPEMTQYRLRTDNPESTTEPIQQVKEAVTVDLGTLLDAGDSAVVTLVAGDTRLVEHRAVLEARSPMLAAMVGDSAPGASSGEIIIPDVGGPVLRHMVAYLYTLRAPQLPVVAPQLLAAADKYGLPALKEACEQQVAAQLTVENAAATAVFAIRNVYTSLREAAIAFMKAHIFDVMATQGWADLVHNLPRESVEVNRLLSEPPPETSTPAAADSAAAPATPPHSDHGVHGRTPTPAVPSAADSHTPPPDNAPFSYLRSYSAEEMGERLIKAAMEGAVYNLEALLAAGADVGARDGNKYTALHWAAFWGHVEAVKRLLAAGAEVDAQTNWQRTPLHRAAYGGHTAVVRLLLAASADPNAKDAGGWTPLHDAASKGHAEAAAALLQAGADRGAKTNEGQTPLDVARKYNHQQLTDILK